MSNTACRVPRTVREFHIVWRVVTLSLLTDDVAQTACRIVASRLDYYNALLSGAPAATFDKLPRAQNNLAMWSARAVVAPTPGRCFTRYTLASGEAAGHL